MQMTYRSRAVARRTALLSAFFTLLLSTAPAMAQEVDSSWRLRLMDLERQSKAEATLHFTDKTARSCMRGKWKVLEANVDEGSDTRFFPLTEPLAYKIDHGVLTIGRSNVCHRYPLLTAISAQRDIHGTFQFVSVGRSRKLGLFTLAPVQP
jgi:hypothetical protein